MKHFPCFCPVNVKWDDVLRQINEEMLLDLHKTIADENPLCRPTLVTHTSNYHGSVKTAYHKVSERVEQIRVLHMYVSFSQRSSTFGWHCDEQDVFILQATGSVAYGTELGNNHILHPGDALYIPKGEYHDPYVLTGPRVTLSFSSDSDQPLTIK